MESTHADCVVTAPAKRMTHPHKSYGMFFVFVSLKKEESSLCIAVGVTLNIQTKGFVTDVTDLTDGTDVTDATDVTDVTDVNDVTDVTG